MVYVYLVCVQLDLLVVILIQQYQQYKAQLHHLPTSTSMLWDICVRVCVLSVLGLLTCIIAPIYVTTCRKTYRESSAQTCI
jgi:hypothetical protein